MSRRLNRRRSSFATSIDVFTSLAAIEGKGSSAERTRQLRDLFARATRDEQDFLRRLLYGELRQGALEGVLIEAVARAAKVGRPRCRRAAMAGGSLGPVARAAFAGGEPALDAFVVQLMRPVQPMLADSAENVEQALEQLGEAALEYKLDGARMQVHKADDDVRIFSRTLRDVTIAAPEVVALVRALPAREPDSRRRGHRAATRRVAASVSGHDEPLRPNARRRAAAAPSCR